MYPAAGGAARTGCFETRQPYHGSQLRPCSPHRIPDPEAKGRAVTFRAFQAPLSRPHCPINISAVATCATPSWQGGTEESRGITLG